MANLDIPFLVLSKNNFKLKLDEFSFCKILKKKDLATGKSLIDATTTTLGTTGSALIGSALTTALAFAVLLFSPLVPFQQFGLVTGITILYALIASIVIVPPMLIVWAAYHEWRAGMAH